MTASKDRSPVPWWVLPAIVASALGSAWLTRWLMPPAAPAVVPVPAVPMEVAPEPEVRFRGLLAIGGQPALALVSVGAGPAGLARAGDPLGEGLVLLRIEAGQLVVGGSKGERVVPLQGAMAALAGPADLPRAAPGGGAASIPHPSVGVLPMPPDDGQAGAGNAAFRAAVAGGRPR